MYMGLLQDQLNNQAAYEKTMAFFKDCLGDEDDEPLLWFALAETQWKTGRLLPEVKDKALAWIEKGALLALWEESQVGVTGWIETLKNLKATLESPVPKEKKIRKPSVLNQNLWNVNDVYAYQFHMEESKKHGTFGKYILIQKIGEGELYWSEGSVAMRVHIFDRLFDNTPTLNDMDGLRLLPIGQPGTSGELFMSVLLDYIKKKEYPAGYLTYLGSKVAPINRMILKNSTLPWVGLEGRFNHFYQLWQGEEYETVEEGVFKKKI